MRHPPYFYLQEMVQLFQRFEAVTLEVTKKCNHRCTFCYNIANESSQNVTKDQIDIVVDKLWKYGIERVTITGGEPYIVRNQTEYLIEELLKRNFDVCLNTNLTLIDDNAASFLERTIGYDNIVYSSIPSVVKDKCDQITQCSGSYDRILNGLTICRRYGIKVGLNMSVSQINIDDLPFIIPFLRNYPVDSFTLFPVIPPVYDRSNISHSNDAENLIYVANTLLDIHNEFGITVGSIRPLPRCIIGHDTKYDIIRGSRCTTGCERFAIDLCTGEVEACSQENKKYGNIYQDSIDICFERMSAWRKDMFLAKTCQNCEYLRVCGGMCLWSEPCGRC